MFRLLWSSTRGYRLRPWRSPYLRWRIETFSGLKADQIGVREFFHFLWRWRGELWRYLIWAGQIQSGTTSKSRYI